VCVCVCVCVCEKSRTAEYTAPELLIQDGQGRYTAVHDIYSDMWSVGVILFALCFNSLPYFDPDPEACHHKILSHESLRIPEFPPRDPYLRHLILALTDKNPFQRPSTDEITCHPRIRAMLSERQLGLYQSAADLATLLQMRQMAREERDPRERLRRRKQQAKEARMRAQKEKEGDHFHDSAPSSRIPEGGREGDNREWRHHESERLPSALSPHLHPHTHASTAAGRVVEGGARTATSPSPMDLEEEEEEAMTTKNQTNGAAASSNCYNEVSALSLVAPLAPVSSAASAPLTRPRAVSLSLSRELVVSPKALKGMRRGNGLKRDKGAAEMDAALSIVPSSSSLQLTTRQPGQAWAGGSSGPFGESIGGDLLPAAGEKQEESEGTAAAAGREGEQRRDHHHQQQQHQQGIMQRSPHILPHVIPLPDLPTASSPSGVGGTRSSSGQALTVFATAPSSSDRLPLSLSRTTAAEGGKGGVSGCEALSIPQGSTAGAPRGTGGSFVPVESLSRVLPIPLAPPSPFGQSPPPGGAEAAAATATTLGGTAGSSSLAFPRRPSRSGAFRLWKSGGAMNPSGSDTGGANLEGKGGTADG